MVVAVASVVEVCAWGGAACAVVVDVFAVAVCSGLGCASELLPVGWELVPPLATVPPHGPPPGYALPMALFNREWQWVKLDLNEEIRVAGDYFYAPGIRRVAGVAGLDVQSALIREPNNPHDENAIRVDLLGPGKPVKCGYVPADIARAWQRTFLMAERRRHSLWAPAHIVLNQDGSPAVWIT